MLSDIFSKRISRQTVDQIHGDHHQRNGKQRDIHLICAQHEKRFAKAGEREERAQSHDPPVGCTQLFSGFPVVTDWCVYQ